MAQSLTIAKAALAASLFRADPISVPRATVDALFPLLHSTVTQCSRLNVQKCKAWIIEHIAPSRGRTAALGKFLVAWSRSLEQGEGRTKPSLRRRRLHALYIVSDVLHHVVVKLRDDGFADALGEHAPALVACAAEFDNCPKHKRKLEDLLALWQDKRFFSDALMAKLRAALTGATIDTPTEAQPSTTSAKDVPYVLPSYHGDLSTPWYDLPAGTWLPHITPNSTKPMIPSLIKPVQLAPGPAGRSLVEAVSQLLTDVDGIFQKRSGNIAEAKTDVNMLGERVTIDEVTGEVIDGETYYGWSRAFCEKMKERKMKAKKGQGRGRSRSRSSDYSRGPSRSPSDPPGFKRRRSYSSSRSPRRRRRSQSYSPRPGDRSRSRSRHSYRRRGSSRSPLQSGPRRHSPPQVDQPPPTRQPPQHQPPFPFSQGNFPPPPPPPAGYQGAWPPPPPPPPPPPNHPSSGMPNIPPMPLGGQWAGGWGPPGSSSPPPPPPPPLQHQQQQYGGVQSYDNEQTGDHRGRGGQWTGHNRGRGRHGYRGGRGRGWH